MKLYNIFALVLILTLSISANIPLQQTAEELYQSALYKEEVEGDLNNAIAIYERIIKEFSSNDVVAAKALFHVGLCYEKLGNQKAQNAFQKVIEDYPGQKDVVRMAREKLALLNKAQAPETQAEEGIKIRKLWDRDTWGTPSPDGRYFVYHHAETGDLAIREIASGKIRRLNLKKSYQESMGMSMGACWSADSQSIAYGWWVKDRTWELRSVDIDGSNVRTLCSGYPYINPTAWSSDGKHILAWLWDDKKANQLGLVKVADGSVKIIQSYERAERAWWPIWQFLPGDDYVVYDDHQGDNSNKKDIFLYSIAEDKKRPLIQNPADDNLLGVLPQGDWIFFRSDRSGRIDLWGIQVIAGTVKGDPILIKSHISEVAPYGITRSGDLFYSVWVSLRNIYWAKLDLEENRITENPKMATDHFTGQNFSPAWSPDGEYLAFGSTRPSAKNRSALCILSFKTGELIEHFPDIRGFMFDFFMHWSPDGETVIYNGRNTDYSYGFFTNDKKSGAIVHKSQINNTARMQGAAISPDGNVVYYSQIFKEGTWRLYAQNLKSNDSKVLLEGTEMGIMSVSPDGKHLAFVMHDSTKEKPFVLASVPLKDFNENMMRALVSTESRISSIAWSPDNQKLIFSKNDKASRQGQFYTLYQIPAAGGDPQKIGLSMLDITHLSIHPDGQHIAFGSGNRNQEVWVMENIIPEKK